MAKTKTKETPVVVEQKKVYHLYLKLNDKVYEVDTDDLEKSILEHKPAILKTSLTLKITKGKKTLDRYLYLRDARRLFTNSITLNAFVRNLFF